MSMCVEKIFLVEAVGDGIKDNERMYFKKLADATENLYHKADEHGDGTIKIADNTEIVMEGVILAGTTSKKSQADEIVELRIVEIRVY